MKKLAFSLWGRIERLLVTLLAKKYLAWLVATILLVNGYIDGKDWVLITGSIFVIDTAQKIKGVGNDRLSD